MIINAYKNKINVHRNIKYNFKMINNNISIKNKRQ